MTTFTAPDGTRLSYRTLGEGPPLAVLPGGPMRDADYLGDLGGLGAHRQLLVLDLPGTGGSAVPSEPEGYRCDRLVAVVEAWRQHLGLERLDLLGHSAGANIAARCAERHGDRIDRLVLVTPGPAAVGIEVSDDVWEATAMARREESWFPPLAGVVRRILDGEEGPDDWARLTPFSYGRWDATAQAHAAREDAQRNPEAANGFRAPGAFDTGATRRGLRALDRPVLLLGGEVDLITPPAALEEYAGLLPDARLVVQPGVGHYPWLDDAEAFRSTIIEFLG